METSLLQGSQPNDTVFRIGAAVRGLATIKADDTAPGQGSATRPGLLFPFSSIKCLRKTVIDFSKAAILASVRRDLVNLARPKRDEG
jgi:hypothetical protein